MNCHNWSFQIAPPAFLGPEIIALVSPVLQEQKGGSNTSLIWQLEFLTCPPQSQIPPREKFGLMINYHFRLPGLVPYLSVRSWGRMPKCTWAPSPEWDLKSHSGIPQTSSLLKSHPESDLRLLAVPVQRSILTTWRRKRHCASAWGNYLLFIPSSLTRIKALPDRTWVASDLDWT